MGFLTTVTIYNDTCDQLQKSPKELAKVLYDACTLSFVESIGKYVSYGGGSLIIQKTRHGNSPTLYLHGGGTVTELFEMDSDSPLLDLAITELSYCLKRLKKLKKERDGK